MLRYIWSHLKYSRNQTPTGPLIEKGNLIGIAMIAIIFTQITCSLKKYGVAQPKPNPKIGPNNVNDISICHANQNRIKGKMKTNTWNHGAPILYNNCTETHLNNKLNVGLSVRGNYAIFRKRFIGGVGVIMFPVPFLIEAETKWPPFCRRHFHTHFFYWKCWKFLIN